jgi:hypothetical protein
MQSFGVPSCSDFEPPSSLTGDLSSFHEIETLLETACEVARSCSSLFAFCSVAFRSSTLRALLPYAGERQPRL